jgi:hypothetical protein
MLAAVVVEQTQAQVPLEVRVVVDKVERVALVVLLELQILVVAVVLAVTLVTVRWVEQGLLYLKLELLFIQGRCRVLRQLQHLGNIPSLNLLQQVHTLLAVDRRREVYLCHLRLLKLPWKLKQTKIVMHRLT